MSIFIAPQLLFLTPWNKGKLVTVQEKNVPSGFSSHHTPESEYDCPLVPYLILMKEVILFMEIYLFSVPDEVEGSREVGFIKMHACTDFTL